LNQIRSIKGTHDILPSESIKWHHLEKIIHEVCSQFGYKEIRTPVFEETRLFSRSVGEDTDIVSKEMYNWEDQNGTSLTLRPELTASVVRSYIQNNLGAQAPIQRLYYLGPLFRRERPQKGRQRQFHQFGVEALGSPHPEQDSEIIALAWHILTQLGLLDGLELHINSIGSHQCRLNYRESLIEFLHPHLDQLSETSQKRFLVNPLRILDTKLEHEKKILQEAPAISSSYTEDDKKHFDSVQFLLDSMDIPFTINSNLVRGLDYYTRTTFEITTGTLGAQNALLGGGRYDKLVEILGGKPTPAIGFAAGMERFLIALESIEKTMSDPGPDIYFICLEEEGLHIALSLCQKLRKGGKIVVMDSLRRSLKAQLREANKSNAEYALILGINEIKTNSIVIKNLIKGKQFVVKQTSMMENF